MGGWSPAMVEEFPARTPRLLQCVGQDGQLVEGPVVVDGLGDLWDGAFLPGEPMGFYSERPKQERAEDVEEVTVHRPKGTAVHSGRSCFNVQTDQPIPGPASLS